MLPEMFPMVASELHFLGGGKMAGQVGYKDLFWGSHFFLASLMNNGILTFAGGAP